MRKIYILFLLLSSGFCSRLFSQTPASPDASNIYLRIKKLNVLGSVLYVAAHPDDENTTLLAYLSKDRLYRTGYLSMTRGDGGQNLIGDEQGVELGLIRTQELLAARRIDGAEQFFARAYDFGYTKTTAEALQTWDKEKILSDVVWVIRRFRPDVIITRFPEDSRAGHGQHSASSVLAHEAFEAAADPKRFPEQFKYGVEPWQARSILWNTYRFGNTNTTAPDQLQIDVGGYNPLIGKSYGELAAESRSQHKSQGFGIPRSRGQTQEFFSWVEGAHPVHDIMDGVATTWSRLDDGGRIQPLVDSVIRNYDIAHPEMSVPALVGLYQAIQLLKNEYWKKLKSAEVAELIVDCAGIWAEATVRNPYAVPGQALAVNASLISRLAKELSLQKLQIDGVDSSFNLKLLPDKNYNINFSLKIPVSEPVTQPYWLLREMSHGSYNVDDQLMIGEAQGKPALTAVFTVRIDGLELNISRAVQYKSSDPVKGELYQPLTFLPSTTAHFEPGLLLFNSLTSKKLALQWQDHLDADSVHQAELTSNRLFSFTAAANSSENEIDYTVTPLSLHPADSYVELMLEKGSNRDTIRELRTISYDHIPRIDYLKQAKAKLLITDCRIAGKRIGYIEGAGDKVPQALFEMGYQVQILKEKDITPFRLKSFDAIITGVRAYDVHDWLFDKYNVLMSYIRDGGNLIVQYNRNPQIGTGKFKMSPYPFAITAGRITDENAKVHFLIPDHPVLHFPNKITDSDFEGWIQERGIYFASQPDVHFQLLFSMSDPGESEQKGSLLIAPYGKGNFVYTGLVFFRELPAGVAGSYRLMANIIALGQNQKVN